MQFSVPRAMTKRGIPSKRIQDPFANIVLKNTRISIPKLGIVLPVSRHGSSKTQVNRPSYVRLFSALLIKDFQAGSTKDNPERGL
jgi:hypothetical protein